MPGTVLAWCRWAERQGKEGKKEDQGPAAQQGLFSPGVSLVTPRMGWVCQCPGHSQRGGKPGQGRQAAQGACVSGALAHTVAARSEGAGVNRM